MGTIGRIARNRKLTKNMRLAVHNGILVPTLMYGSETWTVNECELSKVCTVEMAYLRGMTGKTLNDRVRNDWVMNECGIKENMRMKVQRSTMRWFGHLERMNDERLTKKVYRGNVRGKRGRGRPRKEWIDQIGEIAKEWNLQSENKRRVCMKKVMNIEEMKEICKDRKKWRQICGGTGHP